MTRKRAVERVEHRKKLLDQQFDAAMAVLLALLLDALAVILKIRLAPDERVHQFLLLSEKLLQLFGQQSRCPPIGFRLREPRRTRPGSPPDLPRGPRPHRSQDSDFRCPYDSCAKPRKLTPLLFFRKKLRHESHGRYHALVVHAHRRKNSERSLHLILR